MLVGKYTALGQGNPAYFALDRSSSSASGVAGEVEVVGLWREPSA